MGVSKQPYIGSRDFYPEDMRFRDWMFGVQRAVCRNYGYVEYGAPLIEPVDLYRLKSSDEIVNEQLYRFVDRGEREVAIRPEMTPTLARMVSARLAQMPRPLRWFSVANFMRYERPGRGRLREFYQLNVDLLGAEGSAADAEIVMLAIDILRAYGAAEGHFRVRYSDRRLLEGRLNRLPAESRREVARLLDKREKIGPEAFGQELEKLVPDSSQREEIIEFLTVTAAQIRGLGTEAAHELATMAETCERLGYGEFLEFDPGIVRGFDYYTGFVFEIFDRHPENRRALFGGGRYDRLIGLFGKENVPAVGFGLGDVTLQHFLEAHSLIGDPHGSVGAFVALFSEDLRPEVLALAAELRAQGLVVETALEPTKKLGKQFELAEKKGRRHVLVLGPEEVESGLVRVKDLTSGSQTDVKRPDLPAFLKKQST